MWASMAPIQRFCEVEVLLLPQNDDHGHDGVLSKHEAAGIPAMAAKAGLDLLPHRCFERFMVLVHRKGILCKAHARPLLVLWGLVAILGPHFYIPLLSTPMDVVFDDRGTPMYLLSS